MIFYESNVIFSVARCQELWSGRGKAYSHWNQRAETITNEQSINIVSTITLHFSPNFKKRLTSITTEI